MDQLEKRIAVLTSQNQKLSKMLKAEGHAIPTVSEQQMAMEAEIAEKSRTIVKLERQLEKASQPARGQAKGASLLSGNAGLEQWEAGKALQKKADGLRKRLDEKTKELEQSEKVNTRGTRSQPCLGGAAVGNVGLDERLAERDARLTSRWRAPENAGDEAAARGSSAGVE